METRQRTIYASAVSPALGLALAMAGCAPAPDAAEEAPPPPNVIVVLADDLGYGDIGANGSTVISTPHIDELAANGVRLTDGYVSAAVCSPMRAGLFTGRYQNRFGYEYNPTANYERNADAELGLPEDETTLGDMMREAGYATGLVGKWHLGFREQYHPLKRGFDEFFGHLGGGTSYLDPNDPDGHSWPRRQPATTEPNTTTPAPVAGDRGDGPRAILDGYEVVEVDEYLTDVFADRAVSFIERYADEPFFLMLAPNAPHTPIQATSKYVDRYAHIEEPGARIYAAMVSSVDDMVGRVTATLREHGLEENTLVVFISDNGCINYMPAVICTNSPLSGGKRYHLDGGIRVPYLAKWPAGLPRGDVYSRPASVLDLYATMAAAAGSDAGTEDSVNLLPYLRGEIEEPPHEYLFWRSLPNAAVRSGKWKLWRVDLTDRDPASVLGLGGRLLPEEDYPPVSAHGQITVLHDLEADVGERVNVADQHPEVVERLEAALAAWEAELSEPMWVSKRSTLAELHGQAIQLYF
ncbi:MAG: sulfatase-like hydrolase/transferase [Holophagales bacterium]|nr:sulfatase-like hydrolase/transferase [Holophagales bacterium]MYJ27131.1 sulfatase-like hydrolase/transferase [Holophagales bacterium]